MNAISEINRMPATKAQIEVFKNMVIEELYSGQYDILEIAIKLKALENTIKEILSDNRYKDITVNELEKHPKGKALYNNAELQVCETGVKYDYSNCNDTVLKDLSNEINRLTELKKARENWLKSIDAGTPDQQTGEILNPPAKKSVTNIKITLK